MTNIANYDSIENTLNIQSIIGGGEMGSRIRSFDWAKTTLGPINEWQRSLFSTVNLILQSPAPLLVLWGEEGIILYNDAYAFTAGQEHQQLLGSPCEEIWPQATELYHSIIRQSPSDGNNTQSVLQINGLHEFYFSPVLDDSGKTTGAFIVVAENRRDVKEEETEERLRLILEGTNDGIWDLNLKTRTAYWNDRMYDIFGYSKDEVDVPGIDFLIKITHPEDREKLTTAFNRTSEEGFYYDIEYRVQHKLGNYIYIRVKGKPVFNDDGKVIRIAGNTTDITEQKVAEMALKQSEERFSSIFNQSSVGISQVDLSGKFVLVNDKYCEMVGRSKEELYQIRMQDISHSKDVEGNLFLFQRAVREGIPFRIEKRYIKSDGTELWVNNHVSLVKDTEGKPLFIVAISQDITEQKKAELAIVESEERFRTFANNIQNLAWMSNPDGWTFWYNKRWYDYTGSTPEDSQGFGWASLIHPDHVERIRESVSEDMSRNDMWEASYPLRGADNKYRWFLTRAYAIRDAEGKVIHWIGTNTDIEEQKKAEEELKEKNKELQRINNDLDNFIYTASHDLKAPISNIEGLMGTLVEDLPKEVLQAPDINKILAFMNGSIARFKNTLSDLTDLTKLQKNTVNDEAQIVLADVFEEVRLDLEAPILNTGAEFEVDFSQRQTIRFSRKNLRSIIYNLVSNAIKYHAPDRKPYIRVSSGVDQGYMLLTVKDNGLGINLSQEDKIFTMFKRLHDHVEGSGIGLYIIKKIVENNGGKIEVESEVGKGSTFKVFLPT